MTRKQPAQDGYEAFSDITDATIAAVAADMAHEPRDTLRLFRELSGVNGDVSIAVLAQARQAAAEKHDAEQAFIEGATFVIRLLVKQGKANKLQGVLFPESRKRGNNHDASPAATRKK